MHRLRAFVVPLSRALRGSSPARAGAEEEEDSIAKFKAAFQSPEEIAKAVRTEMHKDG